MTVLLRPEEHFFAANGKQAGSIEEIIPVIASLDEGQLGHHVNAHKNDFGAWIRDCFHENKLADDLQRAKSREDMLRILQEHVRAGKRTRNTLISGDIKDKIRWYLKAHGHSSLGSLNIISTYFEFMGVKEKAAIVGSALRAFEAFGSAGDIVQELYALEMKIGDVENLIRREPAGPKKNELTIFISNVKTNLRRVEDIMRNPGYEERFKLSNILLFTVIQLEKQYPGILYGDLIGNRSEYTGDTIQLHVHEPEDECEILCCGLEMQLLLLNLLSNAADAISGRGNIFINFEFKENDVVIIVSDDGVTITDDTIQEIMDGKQVSRKGQGHGQGLKIIRDIVEKYGGSLAVTKDKHIVSFKVTLPRRC